jgi:hypothetical protein
MTTASYAARRNQNLNRATRAITLGPVSVSFVMIAVVSLLALLYLTQITKTSVLGYKVSELQQRQIKLQSDQQALEIEAARLQSIKEIQGSAAVSSLVPTVNTTYANR